MMSHSLEVTDQIMCQHITSGGGIKTHNEVKLIEILSSRMAAMVITRNQPMYLTNCKLVMLSKNSTQIANRIKDIRPIGILPIVQKVMEKGMKLTIERRTPEFFFTSESQVGYKKGRSTVDNIILVIQRIE